MLYNRVKNTQVWGGIGGLCLVAALLLSRFGPDMYGSDFLQGMFIGMSIVFNITYLIRWGREHRAA